MKNRLYGKILAVGIIVLFMGVSVSSGKFVDAKQSVRVNQGEECSDCENSDSGICDLLYNILISLDKRENLVLFFEDVFEVIPILALVYQLYVGSLFLRFVLFLSIGDILNCDWEPFP